MAFGDRIPELCGLGEDVAIEVGCLVGAPVAAHAVAVRVEREEVPGVPDGHEYLAAGLHHELAFGKCLAAAQDRR